MFHDTRPIPTFSIVINNYNYSHYLREALDSALAQISALDEIVVVDDGSTDASAEVLAKYAGIPQLRIFRQKNQGQLATVFNGLAAARGEICALLDSDDYLLPGYLARLRVNALNNPDVDFFFSDALPGGESLEAVQGTCDWLAAMALPEGPTGLSRWSTWAVGEFLGSPTSGLALRRPLVNELLDLRHRLSDKVPIPGWAVRVFRMNAGSHIVARNPADGVIVRMSSLVGARKYHCASPGFFYRIHGANAYACLSAGARRYLQLKYMNQFLPMARAALQMPARPRLVDVLAEAEARSRPLRFKRRLRLWINYSYAVICSADTLAARAYGFFVLPGRLFRQSAPQAQEGG